MTAQNKPIVSIHSLTLQPRPDAWQPPADAKRRFAVSRARIAPMLGLSKLGVTLHEVPPGATASPFHSHRANEELLFVLAGRGELHTGRASNAQRARLLPR